MAIRGGTQRLVGVVKEVAPTKQAANDTVLGVGEFQRDYFKGSELYLDEDKGGVGAMQAHVASGGSAEDGEGSGEPPEQPVHALVLGRGDVNEPLPRGHAFWHVLETGRGQTHVLLDAS